MFLNIIKYSLCSYSETSIVQKYNYIVTISPPPTTTACVTIYFHPPVFTTFTHQYFLLYMYANLPPIPTKCNTYKQGRLPALGKL